MRFICGVTEVKGNEQYSRISFIVDLQRNPAGILQKLALPLLVVLILACLVFYIPDYEIATTSYRQGVVGRHRLPVDPERQSAQSVLHDHRGQNILFGLLIYFLRHGANCYHFQPIKAK